MKEVAARAESAGFKLRVVARPEGYYKLESESGEPEFFRTLSKVLEFLTPTEPTNDIREGGLEAQAKINKQQGKGCRVHPSSSL